MLTEEAKGVCYHGEVLDQGCDFLHIEAERGYGFIVTIKLVDTNSTLEINMSADQAREFARHLIAAAETADTVV